MLSTRRLPWLPQWQGVLRVDVEWWMLPQPQHPCLWHHRLGCGMAQRKAPRRSMMRFMDAFIFLELSLPSWYVALTHQLLFVIVDPTFPVCTWLTLRT